MLADIFYQASFEKIFWDIKECFLLANYTLTML